MKDQKCSAEDESWHHAMFPQVVNDRPALCTTKVPGSQATPVNVLAIWSSLFRWVSLSRSSFATFLHSFLHNEPSEKPGTTYTLWPSAAPYPELLQSTSLPTRLSRSTLCRRKAVNLIFLVLSWLHMKKPARAPAELSLYSPLNARQWGMVRRLERQLRDVEAVGDIGPAEMGRSAVRVEGLESLLGELHAMAVRLAPQNYAERTVFSGEESASPLKPGRDAADCGEVIGRAEQGVPVLAKDVDHTRLSFPENLPEFDPTKLFSGIHQDTYDDPISQARSPSIDLDRPPRVSVRASKAKAMGLFQFLDRHRRLRLAPPEKIRKNFCCGAFSLVKDEEKDRLILDARPPNILETTLREWCKTLASVQALAQTELLPGNVMYFSGTDLRDFYYCFRISKSRSYRNAFAYPLEQSLARQFGCFTDDLKHCSHLYPCLNTLAMGDCQAVELGQCAHVKLGLNARAFSPYELLTVHGRAPRGLLSAGIVIDDLVVIEQHLGRKASDEYLESEARMDRIFEEYAQAGLTPHPKKTFRTETRAEFWGAAVDGETGFVRAAPRRLVPLMAITSRTARLGFATVALLEVLAGAWVSILQVKRRMLSLLDWIYVVQRGRDRPMVVKLPKPLIDELWLLVILGPLAVSDMRLASIPEVFLCDASSNCMASCKAKLPLCLSQELQRHCLVRGVWSKLLSPWARWLKEHGDLFEEDELPEGVPLVSHPLWKALAEFLQYKMVHRKFSYSRRHINLLELQAVIDLETVLAKTWSDFRYLLGSDSQVALACLVKGRSSSYRLNSMLQSSLAVYLGVGMLGNYGFVPSLSNSSDDLTRNKPLRKPAGPPPAWWEPAMKGDFSSLDTWLESVGYGIFQVAGLPFKDEVQPAAKNIRRELIEPLRAVQKPERLSQFDAAQKSAASVSQSCVRESPEGEKKELTREQKESDDQTKKCKRKPEGDNEPRRSEGKNEPRPDHSVALRQVAPPVGKSCRSDKLKTGRCRAVSCENRGSPLLSDRARELLSGLDGVRFFGPDGRRCSGPVDWRRAGFLDLYSGESGVARALSRKLGVWVLTFDYTHGEDQNLLDERTQKFIFELLREGAFLGCGLAPECASFSRAVTPAVRDRDHPLGKSDLSLNMQEKVARGNLHAIFVLAVLEFCRANNLVYWCENPDGSFLWLLPAFLRSGIANPQVAYRFDMCRYKTPWRKRTRICTNTHLAGMRELCLGQHSHLRLRGRSSFHQQSWTRVAQAYPKDLCRRLADAIAKKLDLKREKLDVAGCARGLSRRIGEASHPGPPARGVPPARRDPNRLLDVKLVGAGTLAIQDRVWKSFEGWLQLSLSEQTIDQLFIYPPLAVEVIKSYGVHLYSSGKGLYELRHLLVLIQQKKPLMRPAMGPAWSLVSKWEEVTPTQHRKPLPELLFKAMFSLATLWKLKRFAACLLLAFEGISRIGEVLRATRGDLLLPEDLMDADSTTAYLRIRRPKTMRRGKGRVQHIRVEGASAVGVLSGVFGQLDEFLHLYPLSSTVFRRRWDKLLDALLLPKSQRPLPSSVRGGGAIVAYRRGVAVQDILWRMRLVSISTLESYLQELAADSLLVSLPESTKHRIRSFASLYPVSMMSLGKP